MAFCGFSEIPFRLCERKDPFSPALPLSLESLKSANALRDSHDISNHLQLWFPIPFLAPRDFSYLLARLPVQITLLLLFYLVFLGVLHQGFSQDILSAILLVMELNSLFSLLQTGFYVHHNIKTTLTKVKLICRFPWVILFDLSEAFKGVEFSFILLFSWLP